MRRLHLALFSLVPLTACVTAPAPMPDAPVCPDVPPAPTMDAWRVAIMDAAIIEPDEIVQLAPVDGESGRFVTWTKFPDSFKPGEDITLAWGETWVTVDGALKERCQAFDPQTLTSDVQMLLGLPEKAEDRFVVTLEVATADLFRPCADPSLSATACAANPGPDVSPEHGLWYEGQSAFSYQLPGGFPWTRLGYTYNWKPGADEVGLMELVIRKGSTAKVISVAPTAEYCAAP